MVLVDIEIPRVVTETRIDIVTVDVTSEDAEKLKKIKNVKVKEK